MLSVLDLRGRNLSGAELRAVLPRAELDVEKALEAVRPICERVREQGGAALYELAERFDGVRPPSISVPAQILADSLSALDSQVRAALEESITRARQVHEGQRPTQTDVTIADGGTVRNTMVPVDRVGFYVPGGRAVYPSSVVMNVVPAQVAGVTSLAVASPPQREYGGLPHPTILAACAMLGIDEVYAVGGAQAIAAFAYGFSDGDHRSDPVSLVTGPGNIYVAAAKRHLMGVVGIDSEAGPTEIMVLADATTNADYVAADLVSQAEHDPQAASILVTADPDFAQQVLARVRERADATKHRERVHEALTGPQSAVLYVDDVDGAIAVANAYAAEHLEIQVANAAAQAARIRNAGAVFVGAHTPVSLGDYLAGSNHVLPTGGCACHSGGLSVATFVKSMQVIEYSHQALAEVAERVVSLAEAEDLPAHGEAIRARELPDQGQVRG